MSTIKRNNLLTENPILAGQWHPTRNEGLSPENVAVMSSRKVWWLCDKGHEWDAVISSRAKGSGCPCCAGKRASAENNLQVLNPTLANQWHPTKNGELTPKDVTAKSHRKVWWQCEKGHEWQTSVAHRSNGTDCPYCCGKIACADNSLQALYPDVAMQWHPTKNGDLTPEYVTAGSNKNYWWQCEKGHEWQASAVNRTKRGSNCPCCSGRTPSSGNNLQELNPELAKQWHPTKNSNLTPLDVTVSSSRKIWWLCEKGHEWKSLISNRSKGIGCPECSRENRTSFPEQAVYFYVKSIFSDALNGYRYDDKWEIDVFVPSLQFGIEYDGYYYHDENRTSDIEKDRYLADKGIVLLRVKEVRREKKECCLEGNTVFLDQRYVTQLLNDVIELCFRYVSENITHETHVIDIDVERDRSQIFELYIHNEKENSLQSQYPEVAKQWHPTKNLGLRPDMVRPGSQKKVWWLCEQGHEWDAVVKSRTNGIGCPACAGNVASVENNLQVLNPDLAKHWHPTKNGSETPADITPKSNRKVWWVCEKGHDWVAAVNNMARGDSCPYCAGKRPSAENNLQALHPDLAKQWHPIRNGDKIPCDVTPGSGKKAWWRCEKGHEWEAVIASRVSGRGCPVCSGRKATFETSLQALNPVLASQWHPTKNGGLTPNDVVPGAGKKVWWQCEMGHEWDAVIQSRSKGAGCPVCRKNRRS